MRCNNKGDLGGISYGLYQSAINVGAVDEFIDWLCNYSDEKFANYGKGLNVVEVNSTEFVIP